MYEWYQNEIDFQRQEDLVNSDSLLIVHSSFAGGLLEDPRKDLLAAFFLQAFITLVVSKVFGKCLSLIHQPAVIGQILAGIVLGPSAMGFIPGFSSFVFAPATLPTFQMVASMGLVFFMFYLGLKLDPREIRQGWKHTLPVASISIIAPVAIGCTTGLWLYSMAPMGVNKVSFILFIGSGIGFSAFPILAAILESMNLTRTSIGVLTISVVAIEDIVVWILLAIASALNGSGSILNGLYIVLFTGGFVAIMFSIIRPLLSLIYKYYLRRNDEYNIYFIVICLLILVAASFTTEVINIHAFFGAFIAGLIIPRSEKNQNICEFLTVRIELFIIEFFLPLYFMNSGLKTHLYLLNTGKAWYTLISIIAIASISKIIPVAIMTKFVTGKNWSYALTTGILLNARGIVQFAVLNIGVELGVLSPIIFAIFVVAAISLTFTTSPLVYFIYLRNKTNDQSKIITTGKTNLSHRNTNSNESQPVKSFRKLRLEIPSSASNTLLRIDNPKFTKSANSLSYSTKFNERFNQCEYAV